MSQRVVVLGGGISGLAAAWNLARRQPNLDILLLERSEKLGGWLQSHRGSLEEEGERGRVFELGPRSLRTAGVAGKTTLALMSDLGLSDDILPVLPSHKGARRRMIYTHEHSLVDVPSGLSWMFRTKPPFSKPLLWTVLREVSQRQSGKEDESVYEFFARRLNKELADYLIDPLCRGVFAGDAKALSIKSCFPLLYDYEQEHGSLVKGALRAKRDLLPGDSPPLVRQAMREKWTIYTLKQGLQGLPEAMQRVMEEMGVKILSRQPCTALRFTADGVQVEVAGGQVYCVDHLVSALPARVLATLLPSDHSSLANLLRSIPSVSVGVVCLEFPGDQVLPPQYQESFGYLVPSHVTSPILGVVFDSSTFPEHNRTDIPSTRLTVMLGGHWFSELFGDPDTADPSTITRTALDTLRDHLGICQPPSLTITRIQKDCIPQYTLGHSTKLESMEDYLLRCGIPVTLVGCSYRGVSVNDCVHNAIQATDHILATKMNNC